MRVLKYAGLIAVFVLSGFVFRASQLLAYEVKAVGEGKPGLLVTTGSKEVIVSKSLEELVAMAKENLAKRLGIKVENISLVSTEKTIWSDASLGCFEPGKAYAQVMTPGYLIVLKAAGMEYDYHASNYLVISCDSSVAGKGLIKIDPSNPLTVKMSLDPALCSEGMCKTLTISQDQKQTELVQDELRAKVAVAITVGESGIVIDGQMSDKPIKLPSEAVKAAQVQAMPGSQSMKIIKMDLVKCEPQPGSERSCDKNPAVYEIQSENQAKLLGVLPVKSSIRYTVGAATGEVLSVQKPLYLKFFSFLFR